MRKRKNIHERIDSNIRLIDSPLCNNCIAKLYYDENEHLKYGFGSLFPKIIIVLPPRAYNNRIYDNYIKEIFKDIVDLKYEYITYHHKCKCDVNVNDYIDKCSQFLLHEINKLKPNIIIFFGVKIPQQLFDADINFKLYYFKDIYSITFNDNELNIFREQIKKIL